MPSAVLSIQFCQWFPMHCIAKYMTTSLAKKNQSDRNSVTDTHPPIPNVDNRERCFLGDKGSTQRKAVVWWVWQNGFQEIRNSKSLEENGGECWLEQEGALARWHVLVNSRLQHSLARRCWYLCRAECVVVVMACNLMTNISYLRTVHPYITPQPHRTYSLRLHLLCSYIFIHFVTICHIQIHYVTFCNIPIDAITFGRFATRSRVSKIFQMRLMPS